jgi:hypothetical protein
MIKNLYFVPANEIEHQFAITIGDSNAITCHRIGDLVVVVIAVRCLQVLHRHA